METKEESKGERARRIKREYYQRNKDSFKKYYESNKDSFKKYYEENKELIATKSKERLQNIKEDKEKYEERLRKSRENKRRYRQQNKEKIKEMDKMRYERDKQRYEMGEIYISPIAKCDLIDKAVQFVDKVEKRKGLVSFEELFGELLDIAFYLPSCNYDKKSVSEQMTDIWEDVKYFAKNFKGKGTTFDYSELKSKNLCKYCVVSPITNTNNCCSRCRNIEQHINKSNYLKIFLKSGKNEF